MVRVRKCQFIGRATGCTLAGSIYWSACCPLGAYYIMARDGLDLVVLARLVSVSDKNNKQFMIAYAHCDKIKWVKNNEVCSLRVVIWWLRVTSTSTRRAEFSAIFTNLIPIFDNTTCNFVLFFLLLVIFFCLWIAFAPACSCCFQSPQLSSDCMECSQWTWPLIFRENTTE